MYRYTELVRRMPELIDMGSHTDAVLDLANELDYYYMHQDEDMLIANINKKIRVYFGDKDANDYMAHVINNIVRDIKFKPTLCLDGTPTNFYLDKRNIIDIKSDACNTNNRYRKLI